MEHIASSLMKLWRPIAFQGAGKKKRYFEGWYLKLVSARDEQYAVIPGVSMSPDGRERHAFIQVITGESGRTAYHRFPYERFTYSRREFDVRIGPNRFTAAGMELDIDDGEGRVSGGVRFSNAAPYPVRLFAPGIMGPYAFVPFMECYHGIVSMRHDLDGDLTVDGRRVDFAGGIGYAEKDWGRSFPSSWVWLQANHFPGAAASVMLSIARIPWLGGNFVGLLCVALQAGELTTFATYTGAVIEAMDLRDHGIAVELAGGGRRLRITATPGKPGSLRAPVNGAMDRTIFESITATAAIELTDASGNRLFQGVSRNCGMEIAGDPEELTAGYAASRKRK